MKKILVGKNSYTLQDMNPLEGMAYGLQVSAIIMPALPAAIAATSEGGKLGELGPAMKPISEALKSPEALDILHTAIKHCYTPTNESLSDVAVFNKWFIENKSDMFELGVLAVTELSKDFLPSLVRTMLESQKASTMEAFLTITNPV